MLNADGRIAPGFSWADSADTRSPADLLRSEGVRLVNGVADPDLRLDSEALVALLDGKEPRDMSDQGAS